MKDAMRTRKFMKKNQQPDKCVTLIEDEDGLPTFRLPKQFIFLKIAVFYWSQTPPHLHILLEYCVIFINTCGGTHYDPGFHLFHPLFLSSLSLLCFNLIVLLSFTFSGWKLTSLVFFLLIFFGLNYWFVTIFFCNTSVQCHQFSSKHCFSHIPQILMLSFCSPENII